MTEKFSGSEMGNLLVGCGYNIIDPIIIVPSGVIRLTQALWYIRIDLYPEGNIMVAKHTRKNYLAPWMRTRWSWYKTTPPNPDSVDTVINFIAMLHKDETL